MIKALQFTIIIVLMSISANCLNITKLTMSCSPDKIEMNQTVNVSVLISGTGTSKLFYRWENGDGLQFHSTNILQVDFNNSDLTLQIPSDWLWTSELGKWFVRFQLLSPDSIAATENYEVVENLFKINKIDLKCNPYLALLNSEVKASALITGTGYGFVRFYWENKLNGSFHSTTEREISFNKKDVVIEPDSGWLFNDETGTGEVKLIVTSPFNMTYTANYRISLSDISEAGFTSFTVSPNPASDFIEISLTSVMLNSIQHPEIKIYNVFGQEVNPTQNKNYLTPNHSPNRIAVLRVDVSSLTSGLYFLRVGERVGKFLKI